MADTAGSGRGAQKRPARKATPPSSTAAGKNARPAPRPSRGQGPSTTQDLSKAPSLSKAQSRAVARDAKAGVKAAKAAEKARRKASNDPADMGRIRQVVRAYQLTHEYDKALPFLLLGGFLLPIAVGVVLGLTVGYAFNFIFGGVMLGALVAMFTLVRRAKAATYRRYAGQAGSAEVALQMLPKQWVPSAVIAANRNRDVVHRTLGPGGLVLIGEGEPGRVRQLLASEVKKHERVAYGVSVTTIIMGDKQGQVPLVRLADHIRKLPKTLAPNQITDIKQRLRALDAVRPPVPIPKGPMPTSARQVKGARQAMRGR